MKIVRAVFKGADGSLGYKTDKTYQLKVWDAQNHTYNAIIIIERTDGGGRCPYKGVERFLDNWTCIKVER